MGMKNFQLVEEDDAEQLDISIIHPAHAKYNINEFIGCVVRKERGQVGWNLRK